MFSDLSSYGMLKRRASVAALILARDWYWWERISEMELDAAALI